MTIDEFEMNWSGRRVRVRNSGFGLGNDDREGMVINKSNRLAYGIVYIAFYEKRPYIATPIHISRLELIDIPKRDNTPLPLPG